MSNPYLVGLTGGIGSGKSTVSRLFESFGIDIVDTDCIAREVVDKGQPLLEALTGTFGPEILTDSGELDRRKLRHLVFADPEKRESLDRLMHPAIRKLALQRAQASTSEYCILVVPLLLETEFDQLVDTILVVDASPAEQARRVVERDETGFAEVYRIIESQMPREERLSRADDVIHNSGAEHLLAATVSQLHEKYRKLSQNRARH